MATRRARIKAIVNVPARRSKANESSTTHVSPKSTVDNNDETSPNDSVLDEGSQCKEDLGQLQGISDAAGEVICKPESDVQDSQGRFTDRVTSTPDQDENSLLGKRPEENLSGSIATPNTIEAQKISIDNSVTNDSKITGRNSSNASESGCRQIVNDSSTEKLEKKKNAETASVTSPLKQRSRLFIRPSPKLVDIGGRGRYPSGNRHKTLSESEDEPKNRSSVCAVDDAEHSAPDSSSRGSQVEKASDAPEAPTNISNDKTIGDNRKNGSVRSGRQRTRNKENRTSDSRRRLWLQMKKGSGPAGPLDRSRLTMFDYIYYNPVSNPMRSSSESSDAAKGRKTCAVDGNGSSTLLEEQVDDPGEGNGLEACDGNRSVEQGGGELGAGSDEGGAMPAPRVKVGPDGELIVDEQSLVIETTGLKEGLEDLEKGPAVVESSSFTNYATYSKRSKGLEWSENETLRFYRALNVVGTDFSLMQNVLFPNRSRRDLKNKFKREERRNSSLVERALRNPEVFSTVEELKSEFAKTASVEKKREDSKKARSRNKMEAQGKRKAEKEKKSQSGKKRKRRRWLVNGGEESEGDSGSDSQANAPSPRSSGLLLDFPEDKSLMEGVRVSPADVVTSSVDDSITTCSQEIVVSNNELAHGSEDRNRGSGGECYGSGSERSQAIDESDGDESVSSESQFFSRVLLPTRSGRVPKRRDVSSVPQCNPKKVEGLGSQGVHCRADNIDKNNRSESVRHGMEVIICSKEAEEERDLEPTRDPLAVELTRFPSASAVGTDFVSAVEPGSLVVIATCSPDNPSQQVLQLFMVSPGQAEDGSRVLIPQNLSNGYKVATVQEGEERADSGSSTVVTIKNPSGDSSDNVSTCSHREELVSCSLTSENGETEEVS